MINIYEENLITTTSFRNKDGQQTARKHQGKKQAFGEIKNVLNVLNATPKYSDNKLLKIPNNQSIKKIPMKLQEPQKKSPKPFKVQTEPKDDFNFILDDFRITNNKKYLKPDEEIWCDADWINDAIIEKALNGGDIDFHSDHDYEEINQHISNIDNEIDIDLYNPYECLKSNLYSDEEPLEITLEMPSFSSLNDMDIFPLID